MYKILIGDYKTMRGIKSFHETTFKRSLYIYIKKKLIFLRHL